jgi:hypothetical protein
MAQKVVQYQAVLQLAQSAPQLYNLPLLHRQMIEVLGIKNANKLVPVAEDAVATDPVQENQNLLTGKPVKAFIEQNHQAHLGVHMGAMQDPKIMKIVGQNPQAQMIQAAMMAHINEHVAFEYRRQMEEKMGRPLPSEEETKNMSPEMADQVAVLAAQASQAILQQNQQSAQQEQAKQQMQDPVIQMQMQELQIKQGELQLKQQKMQIDAAGKADQIRVEEARIEAQKDIAAMQVGATAAAARDRLDKQMELDGTRLGADIARQKAQQAQQERQQRAAQFAQNRTPRNKGE